MEQNMKIVIRKCCFLMLLVFAISQTINVTKANQETKYDFANCPVQISNPMFTGLQGSCNAYESRGGGRLNFVAYNQKAVAWISYMQAGTNRFYRHQPGKSQTTRNLKEWNYVKDNWISIKAAKPRTTYVNDNLKVVLYEVDLNQEKRCLGFSHGFGNSGDTGGAPGYNKVLYALICPLDKSLVNADLVEMVTELKIKSFRW